MDPFFSWILFLLLAYERCLQPSVELPAERVVFI